MSSELQLLMRYHHQGDPSAFAELVRAHGGMVFATARRVTRDAALAEDVMQEVFLSLARQSCDKIECLAAWLHRVTWVKARNMVVAESRRHAREAEAAALLAQEHEQAWMDIEPLLDEVLNGLPERTRTVLVEHFLEQRSQKEIARRLGWSQSTVSRCVESGLAAVRQELCRQGVVTAVALSGVLSAQAASAAVPTTLTMSCAKIALSGIGMSAMPTTCGFSFPFLAMTTTTKTILGITGAVLLVPAVWLVRSHVASPAHTLPESSAASSITSRTDSRPAVTKPAPLPSVPPSVGSSLEERLAAAEKARDSAQAEVSALKQALKPMDGKVVVVLGSVSEIGKRTGAILPALAELQSLLERDPASLDADSRRRLLELQRQNAEVLGMLPEIAGFQDRPEEYGSFFRNMIQQSAGLSDAQAQPVEDYMRQRAQLMNAQRLNAANEPTDPAQEAAWEQQRDAFNAQTAEGLRNVLPPGAAERAGLSPELLEFLELDFDQIPATTPSVQRP